MFFDFIIWRILYLIKSLKFEITLTTNIPGQSNFLESCNFLYDSTSLKSVASMTSSEFEMPHKSWRDNFIWTSARLYNISRKMSQKWYSKMWRMTSGANIFTWDSQKSLQLDMEIGFSNFFSGPRLSTFPWKNMRTFSTLQTVKNWKFYILLCFMRMEIIYCSIRAYENERN